MMGVTSSPNSHHAVRTTALQAHTRDSLTTYRNCWSASIGRRTQV